MRFNKIICFIIDHRWDSKDIIYETKSELDNCTCTRCGVYMTNRQRYAY